jgi:pimeloyl-ACP methyl ester carboxylesterase
VGKGFAHQKGNQMSIRGFATRVFRRPVLVAAATVASLVFVPTLAGAASGNQSAAHGGAKPTIVLVHGAWADASSWSSVTSILQNDGYTVDVPPNPLRGLTSDSAYITSYLKTVTGPIVLVGHSYGGAVITNAATGNPNVKALVYIDAFAPNKGQTLQGLTFALPGSCLNGGGKLSNVFNEVVNPSQPAGDPDLYLKFAPGTDYPGWDACFANGVAPRKAALLQAGQRPLAAGAFTETSGVPAWKTIPSWYQIGTEDHAIPPAELLVMAKQAGSKITYVKAGHLSMVSHPVQTSNLIITAVNATR